MDYLTLHPPRLYALPFFRSLLVTSRADELASLVRTLLDRLPSTTCYVVVFGSDRLPMEHIFHPHASHRGQAASERMLQAIRALADLSPRVVVVDWEWHLRTNGGTLPRDERLWYLGRMRLGPVGLAVLAELVAQHRAANQGMSRKVAVVDLDNVLWGGVAGEDGLRGLVLGNEGLGLAFQDCQREFLKLHDSGVVLSICSKNNPEDAWEVFDNHPATVLTREHFAATRINWNDKASNLEELSDELGLGLDSFVFFDDNPVEREWVRKMLPEVMVPDLPEDPAYLPDFLRRVPFFQRIVLTEADTRRMGSYRAQGLRRQEQDRTSSMEEFLASLGQEVVIEGLCEGSLDRAAQMCQRTNQFNLTTHRYTIADLENMQKDPSIEIFIVGVKDRFADSGITGLGILRFDTESADIDTFLLSCRVLGRKVEDVFLAFMAQHSRELGLRYLTGYYIPTAKNGQVASLYPEFGFDTIENGTYRLDFQQKRLEFPPQISVKVNHSA